MRLKNLLAYLALVIFFLFGSGFVSKNQLLFNSITAGFKQLHLKPLEIDDELSKKFYLMLFKKLDYSQSFFVETDLNDFREFELQLDDHLKTGKTDFINILQKRMIERVQELEQFCFKLLSAGNLNLEEDEEIETDGMRKTFYASLNELKTFWKKRIKFLVLTQYFNLLKEAKVTADDSLKDEYLQKAISSTSKTLRRYFDNLKKRDEQELTSLFVNAYIALHDPHSSYLAPRERESFEIEMRGSLEGIGALLGEEDEYVKVVEIVPGGPAWKSKQLQVGDLILKVAQAEEEPVDIVGMRVFDAVRLIRGKRGTKVRLTIKKSDGQITVISLIREKVEIKETYAQPFVIERNNRKFGYIYLPRFYHDFQESAGRNAADDIKKIIQEMKNHDIQGVVLDLRSNGGGALDDAVRLTGLFISSGPVVKVKDRRAGVFTHYDRDNNCYYSGPLLVLINRYSASASEIVAAALQDYRRAVIVGSGNSFGKGTVQMVIDLDNILNDKEIAGMKPFGALALTVQLFYRVSGQSTQFNGVTPDILVPDGIYSGEIGEKYLDYPLQGDRIDPVSFEPFSSVKYNLHYLRKKSSERIKKNSYFDFIDNANRRQDLGDDKSIALSWRKFFRQQQKIESQSEELKRIKNQLNLKFKPFNKSDNTTTLLETIASDYMLDEALNIIEDILNQQK